MNLHNSTPAKGFRDILPAEAILRDYVTTKIMSCYQKYGYSRIETPCVENLDRLAGSDSGENQKLIFKILKRGEKLDIQNIADENGLADLGLRFDLTVPLTRFYAANHAILPRPFKVIQIGSVWRAERPQKGRFRQFTQCDIDIIGLESCTAEIDLISATANALLWLQFSGFKIKINDRRLLISIASHAGLSEEDFDRIFISLDKVDKIGIAGVKSELIEKGYASEKIDTIIQLMDALKSIKLSDSKIFELLPTIEPSIVKNLNTIIECVSSSCKGDFEISFDPSLVRGLSYYTGPIFEIQYGEYNFSIAGGGRYDKMIGRYLKDDVPACGFSIGFERIITILMEKGLIAPEKDKETKKIAFIYNEDISDYKDVVAAANRLRESGNIVSLEPQQKKLNKQLENLKNLLKFDSFCVYKQGEPVVVRELV